jgi:tRNA(Ile)-lysidine synthase
MREEFIKYSSVNGLLPADGNLLAAVSGGIDSMVMVNLYLESGIKPAVAHCNFSLRGEESDGDEEFVKEFADQHDLVFHNIRFDTSGFALSEHLSIQMAARELRYRWFEEIREKNHYDSIAVAHNLNDNAETFFINLLRGTGINGLTGMKPRNGYIIRPLLFASREEIFDYAKENNIRHREDSSNAQVKYTRNKIRHKVFPILKEINPDALIAITSTMERLSGTADIAAKAIAVTHSELFTVKGDEIHVNISELRKICKEKTLIFELFRQYNITPQQCDELTDLLDSPVGKMLFTGNYRIIRDRSYLIITPLSRDQRISVGFKDIRELIDSESFSEIITGDADTVKIDSSPYSAFLDADLVKFPITYRRWEPGDRFTPLGMSGMKKISDFLVDTKVSLAAKERVMVLLSGNDIIWVTGYRIDNRFRVTEKTKRILKISL